MFAAYELAAGDLDAAFAAADLILEGEYRVGHQEQLYIENNAMIAVPSEDGGVTVHGSLQCPYYVHSALKRGLAMDDVQARVVQAETGGGFGGKEEYPSIIALHAALLAGKAGRPVRMIYDRHEDIAATTKRHPAIVRHRTGVTRDGRLVAQDIEVVMDGGAYCTLTPVVLSRGAIHAGGPYRCPNVRIRARATRTNTPPNGAFRGFGAPQTEFAAETQLNRIAEALGMSPLEIRRRNVYRPGDTTPTGQVLRDSVAGEEVLERAAEAGEFERLRARHAGRRATGRAGSGTVPAGRRCGRRANGWPAASGLALAWHGAGFTGSGEVQLASVASLELTADGRDPDPAASTEMGQGTKTIFPQLVAEALGSRSTTSSSPPQDTAFVPNSGPTVASRTAMVVGGLLVTGGSPAARGGRGGDRRVLRRHVPGLRPDERPAPDRPALRAVSRASASTTRRTAATPIRRSAGRPASHRWTSTWTSGEVHVRDVVAADDIGRVIHPVLAEGQVEGGTLQAIGYATIEEIKLRDGRYLNDRLATYIIPTSLDAPRITTILVEAPFGAAPHGAKGVGELPMDVGAPAVVAAIADATGVWITDLPASPERILAALAGVPAAARFHPVRRNLLWRGSCREPADRRPRSSQAPRVDPDEPMSRYRFTVNAVPGRGRRARDAPPPRRPARGPRPDRHQGRLRRGRVRRVHRPARRLARRQLPRAGLPGGWLVGGDGRGPRAARAGSRWPAVLDRLQSAFLTAGGAQCGICTPGMLMAARAYLDDGGGARRGRDPRGDRRQPLPLHGLHRRSSRRIALARAVSA